MMDADTLVRTSVDALGLYAHPDEGCQHSPLCLDCPLPLCKYDDPGGEARRAKARRDSLVMWHLRRGATVLEIARKTGIGERTIYRIQRNGVGQGH